VNPDTEQPFRLDQMAPRPRRRVGLIAGIAAGAVLLIAASVAGTLVATQDRGTPVAQQTQATPASTPAAATTTAAAPTTAATPTPPAPTTLAFGGKADSGRATITVYAYKQPVAGNAPRPDQEGFEWSAADVEICSKVDSYMSRTSWSLSYADHTTIDPSSIGYRQFPAPEYPWDERDVAAGQCVRGWLTFAVPAGKRPATVHYQPQSFQADWKVT